MKINKSVAGVIGASFALSLVKSLMGSKSMEFSHIVATDLLEQSGGNPETAKMRCRQQYGEGSQITDEVCEVIDQYARIQ